ncbi:MAG: M14 family metallocarboxypeptidase [Gammaproteobacteria bacterium]|nr:M14 family metallocarboxypeptidase [Gammaproteobacteria bacterium]
MNTSTPYPIGVPGTKWGAAECAEWLSRQQIKRSYAEEVLATFDNLETRFERYRYGALAYDPERYPLYVFTTREWSKARPGILITGGVHGYETSGVQGALRFMATCAGEYERHFNFVAAPCISPWGYETINRWNPGAIDPNRSFFDGTPAQEAEFIMRYLNDTRPDVLAHFDLHETTDSDNNEFRPALAARDGSIHKNWHIPDGFYTVDNSARPQPEFQAAVIAGAEQVTHIAAPDQDGKIIGKPMLQHGVIEYDADALFLCMSITQAPFVTTTEVYPDSPRVTDEICIRAQVSAICSGLDYLISRQ